MDRHEFACQYQAVYRHLWLVAVAMLGDRTAADDIVQEATVIAFRRISEFRSGSSFSAWVTEIVRRCALNYRRKAKRRKTFATDPLELDQHLERAEVKNPVTSAGLDGLEIDDAMFRALNQLTDEARCCMLLRIVDGLSYAEISSLLGIPEGTAMSHVHRSKKIARQRLGEGYSTQRGNP